MERSAHRAKSARHSSTTPTRACSIPVLRIAPRMTDSYISYPGTLNWHQGLDIAVNAFAIAVKQAPAYGIPHLWRGQFKA